MKGRQAVNGKEKMKEPDARLRRYHDSSKGSKKRCKKKRKRDLMAVTAASQELF